MKATIQRVFLTNAFLEKLLDEDFDSQVGSESQEESEGEGDPQPSPEGA